MGSKTEGSELLDIHFGNKTNVDICRTYLVENDITDHFKKAFCTYPTHYMLGYVRLLEDSILTNAYHLIRP
jgi:hypothetical protein